MKTLKMVLIAFVTLTLFSSGLAQSTIVNLDLTAAFTNVAAFAAFLAGWVAFARAHISFVETLKGWQVAALSIILGIVIGGAGQYIYPVAVEPFQGWGKPFGGLAFGAFAGFTASGGFDLIKGLLTGKTTSSKDKS
jgi:hypothetical protein